MNTTRGLWPGRRARTHPTKSGGDAPRQNAWRGIACFVTIVLGCLPLLAQQQPASGNGESPDRDLPRVLKDPSQRGTLHDAFQRVRGDSGKWNDDPRLQHAPPLEKKPPKTSLDDWADLLQRKKRVPSTTRDDNWLLFKTRQLDDNDRVWIERVERQGNQFTVVVSEAIWQGRYFKSFTYYNVFGVNLGKLPAGQYQVTWIVKPLVFREFAGTGRPRDQQRKENWSTNERPAEKRATELSAAFTVVAPHN